MHGVWCLSHAKNGGCPPNERSNHAVHTYCGREDLRNPGAVRAAQCHVLIRTVYALRTIYAWGPLIGPL